MVIQMIEKIRRDEIGTGVANISENIREEMVTTCRSN